MACFEVPWSTWLWRFFELCIGAAGHHIGCSDDSTSIIHRSWGSCGWEKWHAPIQLRSELWQGLANPISFQTIVDEWTQVNGMTFSSLPKNLRAFNSADFNHWHRLIEPLLTLVTFVFIWQHSPMIRWLLHAFRTEWLHWFTLLVIHGGDITLVQFHLKILLGNWSGFILMIAGLLRFGMRFLNGFHWTSHMYGW